MPHGTVLELRRYPVKSMGGERLAEALVTDRGLAGDRIGAAWQRRGRRLSARVAPKLLRWTAWYDPMIGTVDPDDPEPPFVKSPSGRLYEWDTKDDGLRYEIAEDLGREIVLVRDPGGLQDLAGTVLVTFEASRRRLEDELGEPLDIRRFRPNIHVAIDDAEPFAETGWEGATLRIGEARLAFDHACDRCAITIHDPDGRREPWPDVLRRVNEAHDTFFGFRATVVEPGRVREGDPVEVELP